MRMNNFRHYEPEVKTYGEGVQYFCDDKGRDFYESHSLFTKKYVVLFDSFGLVKAVAKATDVGRTIPLGLSVIDINVIPKDFDLFSGIWLFDGKMVVSVDFDPSVTTAQRKERVMKKLGVLITPLKDAVDMGEATKEEVEKYDALRKLRVKLMRISDDTPAGDVDWSEFTTA